MGRLVIKSPKGTRVKSIGAISGHKVSVGDVLFELHDFEELALISSIDLAIAENLAKIGEVTGPRPKEKLEALQRIAQAKIESSAAAVIALDGVRQEYYVGSRTTIDMLAAQSSVTAKAYQVLQSAIEADVYEKNTADSAEILNHIDEILRKERSYIDGYRGRLIIKSPISGVFKTEVEGGTPVKLGSILGSVEK